MLYVGKAKNLRNRVRQYFQKSRALGPRIEQMLSKATDLEIIVTDSEVEALILEANLIKKLRPRYNVSLKDDKSYPYIVITSEPYPRVFITRQIRRDGSRYFGPYTDVKNVRSALKSIRDIFMIRSCNFLHRRGVDQEEENQGLPRLPYQEMRRPLRGPRFPGAVQRDDRPGGVAPAGADRIADTDAPRRHGPACRRATFEEAALIRDRIKGLEAYSERQKAVDLDARDRDIMAFSADGDDACGVIFKLRDGKMMGRQHYYLGNVEGKPEGEILETLLQQYYLDADDIPSEVVIQTAAGRCGGDHALARGEAGGERLHSTSPRRGRRRSSCG